VQVEKFSTRYVDQRLLHLHSWCSSQDAAALEMLIEDGNLNHQLLPAICSSPSHSLKETFHHLQGSGVSRPGVCGGRKSNRGAKKVFACLNTKGSLQQSLGVTQKWLSFVGQKVAIFVGRTMQFFRE